MKPHRYALKRDVTFLSITGIGVGYILLLLLLFSKVITGCLMQLVLLTERLNDPFGNVAGLVMSSQFMLDTIVGVCVTVLLLFSIRGAFVSMISAYRTYKYIGRFTMTKVTPEGVKVFKSKQVSVFTAGILKPTIYISSQLYNSLSHKQFQTVILHERYHQKSMDPLKKWIVQFVSNITKPFFPDAIVKEFELLTELACDEYTEARLESKRPIVQTLLYMVQANSVSPTGVNAFAYSPNRISILVGKDVFQMKRLILKFVVFFGVLVTGLLWTTQTQAFSSCDHIDRCFSALFTTSGELSAESQAVCDEHAPTHLVQSINTSSELSVFQSPFWMK